MTTDYLGIVLSQLSELGYDAEWGIVPASAAGAVHRRKRWWCVAYPAMGQWQQRIASNTRQFIEGRGVGLADAKGTRLESVVNEPSFAGPASAGYVADAASIPNRLRQIQRDRISTVAPPCVAMGDTTGAGLQRPEQPTVINPFTVADQPESKSILGRAIDGLPVRMDGYIPVAGPGESQYPWEAPRTVPRGLPNRPSMLEALGNSVYVPLVQVFAAAIRGELERKDRL